MQSNAIMRTLRRIPDSPSVDLLLLEKILYRQGHASAFRYAIGHELNSDSMTEDPDRFTSMYVYDTEKRLWSIQGHTDR